MKRTNLILSGTILVMYGIVAFLSMMLYGGQYTATFITLIVMSGVVSTAFGMYAFYKESKLPYEPHKTITLQEKMDKLFAETPVEEIVKELKSMGYTFDEPNPNPQQEIVNSTKHEMD